MEALTCPILPCDIIFLHHSFSKSHYTLVDNRLRFSWMSDVKLWSYTLRWIYEWSTIVFPVGISDGMIGISELENPNGAQKFQKLYLSLPFTSVYVSEMRLKLWINSEQVLSMGVEIKNIQQIHYHHSQVWLFSEKSASNICHCNSG